MAGPVDQLLGLIEFLEACARERRLWARWIETDEVFVQLLRMCDVLLPLFKLSGLEQLFRLVSAAGCEGNAEDNSSYVDPWFHNFSYHVERSAGSV